MRTPTKVFVATLAMIMLALWSTAAHAKYVEPLPDFGHPKVMEDVEEATRQGYDPYLVLAHIRIEAGPQALYVGRRRFRESPTHTYVRSASGDYGRHQIHCESWRKHQAWHPVPDNLRIRKCRDLYRDKLNRGIYYHTLNFWKRKKGSARKMYGVPYWMGHYNTGFSTPRRHYLRKLGQYLHKYRHWRRNGGSLPGRQRVHAPLVTSSTLDSTTKKKERSCC